MRSTESLGVFAAGGDPTAMREFASRLRAEADAMLGAAKRAAASVPTATFVGPAGDATRLRADHLRMRATKRSRTLHALADAVARAAGEIERDQDAARRREERNRKLAD